MKPNYDKTMMQVIDNFPSGTKPKLLLHSCCGPCSSAALERLYPHFDITVLFYNPNIMPQSEYSKRLKEQKKVIEVLSVPIKLIEHIYDIESFICIAKGYESEAEGGSRCQKCIAMRLEETAKIAANEGYDYFCTTLSVSPHKDVFFINEVGKELAKKYSVSFLPSDFKKRSGYLRSTVFCKENNIYRQNYCGCIFSKSEQSVVSSD